MFQSTDKLHAVDLADVEKIKTKVTGKLFKKEIVTLGEYSDQWFPELKFELNEDVAKQFIKNFEKGVAGRIAVPAMHTTDPEQNRGELLHMELEGNSLMGYIDIRSEDTVKDIEEGRIWDDSISFTEDYVDSKGVHHGYTITHVALVNNPYIKDMKPFQALSEMVNDARVALSEMFAQPKQKVIMLSESTIRGDQDMLVKLSNDKKFDILIEYSDEKGTHNQSVKAGESIEVPADQENAVKKQFEEAVETPAETPEEKEAREKKEAEEAEEAKKKAEEEEDEDDDADDENLSAEERLARSLSRENKLKSEKIKSDAEAQFAELSKAGKVVPAQKEAFMAFATAIPTMNLSEGAKTPAQLLSDMFATAKPVLEFGEKGANGKKTQKNSENAYENLSEAEQKGLKALSISPERYNDQVKKHSALFSNDNVEEK